MSFYRSPKTQQERREAAQTEAEEDAIPVRAKRNHRNLVDGYDDIPRARKGHGWKAHRHQQARAQDRGQD